MRAIIALALASFLTAPALAQEDYEPGEPRWSFAIHGGAGLGLPSRETGRSGVGAPYFRASIRYVHMAAVDASAAIV